MTKAEWGTKRICQSCGAKYYDLQRSKIACPKCGAAYDPDALLRSRRVRPAAKPSGSDVKEAKAKVPVPAKAEPEGDAEEDLDEVAAGDDEIDDLIDDDSEDEAPIEDVSELGEDDDMSDVVIEKEEKEA